MPNAPAFLPLPTTGGPSGAAAAAASAAAATATAPAAGGSGARICEACLGAHAGHYGSGRFCGVGCARRQGARRKWSVTPKARRAKRERAPCEACRRLHDRTYASGRFCSVNCALRQAASQKWSKSRAERSRRLDAIRPAAPPPLPTPPPPAFPLPPPTAMRAVCACPCAVVYGPPHHIGPPHAAHPPLLVAPPTAPMPMPMPTPMPAPMSMSMPPRPPPPIVYAPALAVPWAPAPLAHAPLQLLVHAPPRAGASIQLARRPVTPPSPPRSTSPRRRSISPRTRQVHTREGDASEALLCLGGGDEWRDNEKMRK